MILEFDLCDTFSKQNRYAPKKRVHKQTSKQTNKQASKQTNKQTNKQITNNK